MTLSSCSSCSMKLQCSKRMNTSMKITCMSMNHTWYGNVINYTVLYSDLQHVNITDYK